MRIFLKLLPMVIVSVYALAMATPMGATTKTNKSLSRKIERAIRHRFGPAHSDTAICLAAAESTGQRWRPGMIPRFNPYAVSSTDDYGLFQIHRGLEKYGRRIYNFIFNIRVAYRKSDHGRNWWPWTGTYGRGLCQGLD